MLGVVGIEGNEEGMKRVSILGLGHTITLGIMSRSSSADLEGNEI